MRALPSPQATGRPGRRLQVLLGLAVVVGIGIAFWPARPVEDDVVVSPQRRTPRPAPLATTDKPAPARESQPRLVRAAAVDLFAGHSWYRPPPPPPPRPVEVPVPTAPPFPYAYLGQYERRGDKPVYFLQRGESVFDAQVGQVLDGVWHIDAVAEGQMRLTYIPLKLQQVISVGSSP